MKKMIMGIVSIILIAGVFILSRGKVEYNYTMEGKEGITDKQVGAVKVRVDKIYSYLNDIGCETEEVNLIVAEYSKFKRDKKEIIIDANIDDFELMKIIMRYQFSDYTNYGLMYGTMYDMAQMKGFEFEEVKSFTIEEIQEYWQYMYVSFVNFSPDVASKEEIERAKYISTEVLKYVKEEYGKDYLLDLMRDSGDVSKANRINEILDEWMRSKDPEYSGDKLVKREVFNIFSPEGLIEYTSERINWIVDLNTHQKFDYIGDIYESTEIFFEYMSYLYDEIDRLQEVLDVKKGEIPTLTVKMYPEIRAGFGGVTSTDGELIELADLWAFPHEYVHHIDYSRNGFPMSRAVGEMRAEYYSKDFKLNIEKLDNYIKYFKRELSDMRANGNDEWNAYEEVANYLGRDLNGTDCFKLFNDLMLGNWIKDGNEIPSLYDCSKPEYPTPYWISIVSYIERNFGDEAIESILYRNELPDGTKKRLDDVIEEWKEYLKNIRREDYQDYYDMDELR